MKRLYIFNWNGAGCSKRSRSAELSSQMLEKAQCSILDSLRHRYRKRISKWRFVYPVHIVTDGMVILYKIHHFQSRIWLLMENQHSYQNKYYSITYFAIYHITQWFPGDSIFLQIINVEFLNLITCWLIMGCAIFIVERASNLCTNFELSR